jgi:hypothetical protein
MPAPTYLVFTTTVSFGDFDKVMADGMAATKAMTPAERETMDKFSASAIGIQTNRFRLNPRMSYVPRSVREQDPAFWTPRD